MYIKLYTHTQSIDPYPANYFCPENVIGIIWLLTFAPYIQTHFRLLLIMEANTMNTNLTAPKEAGLICAHIVCNIKTLVESA